MHRKSTVPIPQAGRDDGKAAAEGHSWDFEEQKLGRPQASKRAKHASREPS